MDYFKKIEKFSLNDIKEIERILKTSENGLTSKEAEERLKIYGENYLRLFKIDILEIFKRNFLNLFNLLLLFASIFSFLTSESKIEPFIILFFFFLAISVSIFQDYRSSKLLEKLLKFFKNYSLVKRDGEFKKIDQKFLVPGDLVKIKNGDLVPADIRILKAEELLVDESILTGESAPIYKTEKEKENFSNILFSGSSVIKGEALGYVIFTGKESFVGSLAKRVAEIKKETIYKKILDDFAKKIFWLALILGIFIIGIKLIKGDLFVWKELLVFIIVLIVAMVPEFLPAMTVLTLSLASHRLAKRGLLVKRISVLEDLGTIEVICTDKTGTITTNKLFLKNIYSDDELNFAKYFLMDYYFTKDETPYETAVLQKYPLSSFDYSNFEFLEDVPFDPLKRIEKIVIKDKQKNKIIEVIKGAPENVLEICFSKEGEYHKWLEVFINEDKNGYRTLALALNQEGENQFLGIVSFEDPIKPTSFKAIEMAKKLNLEIKILTGDSPEVAKRVALELKISDKNEGVILGEEIRKLDESTLEKIVHQHHVFARLLPEDKLKIIKILEKKKATLFLGEGINDLLALREADVSIVVDSAADISKQEADLIILNKDLKTIVEAVYEGRKSIENIGKYLKHTMSDNFGNLISVSFLTIYLPFLPLTPIQILLTNFLTDVPLIAFANDEVNLSDIKNPVKFDNKKMVFLLLVLGLVAALSNVLAYLYIRSKEPQVIRTFIFLTTTFTGLFVSLFIRNKSVFLKQKPNFLLFLLIFLALSLTLVFVSLKSLTNLFGFANLSSSDYLFLLFIIFLFCLGTEIVKILFYKKFPDMI